MYSIRREELNSIYKFIDSANVTELASIIEEINFHNENIYVFNEKNNTSYRIQAIHVEEACIKLYIVT